MVKRQRYTVLLALQFCGRDGQVKALPVVLYNNIVPVFIAIGLGYTLERMLKIEIKSVSRTIFYVLSPCLVFSSLAQSAVSGGQFWPHRIL